MKALVIAIALVACSAPSKPVIVVPYESPAGSIPEVGVIAGDFTIDGVSLSGLAAGHRSVTVVFYRGFW